MKFYRKFLIPIFLCLPFLIFAQEEQDQRGQFLVGVSSQLAIDNSTGVGYFGFGSSHAQVVDQNILKTEHITDYWGFNLAPKIGFFINPFLVVGIDSQFGIASISSTTEQLTINSGQLMLAPFVRFCLSPDYQKAFPFLELSSGIGLLNNNISTGTLSEKEESDLFQYGGLFGLSIPLSESAFFDLGLRYSSYSRKKRQNNPDAERIIDNSLGFQMGFSMIL